MSFTLKPGYSYATLRANINGAIAAGWPEAMAIRDSYNLGRASYFRAHPGGFLVKHLTWRGKRARSDYNADGSPRGPGERKENPDPERSASDWVQIMSDLRDVKPRPLAKMFGTRGPTPEQLEAYTAKVREWNARYRYASKMQKAALVRDNAAFHARQSNPVRELPISKAERARIKAEVQAGLTGLGAQARKAAALYTDFTGHEDVRLAKVRIPDMPRALLTVGKIDGIMYSTVRDGVAEKYIHKFKSSARPLFCVSPDGKQLFMLGGAYDFTERGIVDKA